ncbi:MAG: hypothetical protein JWQ14_3430 [Adhaeribacter sp.]|jgi:hypothetical protein|nr:hypothetical protein [Adhaeribacter sp.]
MFDITFNLFHDENFSDFFPDNQPTLLASGPAEINTPLRQVKVQPGITHPGEWVPARPQGENCLAAGLKMVTQ